MKASHARAHEQRPRPAAPEICLEDHYAAAALTGLLAAQAEAPPQEWAKDWAFSMGTRMAREARRRRQRR